MPLSFAFKIAARSAQISPPLDAALDLEISRFTGGPYCHVEAWIDGPINFALCFSSRQPAGTYFRTIDLSDKSLWRVVSMPTTPVEDQRVMGFCIGCSGRKYDTFGILGIGLGTTIHDPYDRICSEVCFEIVSDVLHKPMAADWVNIPTLQTIDATAIQRWEVAPSGVTVPGKLYGFYELLTALPGVTIIQ